MLKFLALLALLVVPSLATFSQGSLNLTRDWQLHYSKSVFSTSEAFCKSFRSKCVDYAGAQGAHHQLDCVFSTAQQAGPTLYAFCGGKQKNADGSWTGVTEITDYTKQAAALTKSVTVKKEPMGQKACLKRKAKYPKLGIVC
ncbi:hypothetical protein BCR35DRAFT_305557 [Leucosporidium creatinivorum]|uniref:Uncharacterized protein n=1 Tax=Leucosporidium creatinivorum TaxID=106004 RepID=A0A1Y2F033_9BASI|nr:hypothetical protein BCR35DRAFT_305557 [Leucosporidium creatinivorum]